MGTLYSEHVPNQWEEEVTWPQGLRPLLSALLAHRYEVEINRHTAAENELVVLKKVRERTAYGLSSFLYPDTNQLCSGLQPTPPGRWLVPEWGWSQMLERQDIHPGNGQRQARILIWELGNSGPAQPSCVTSGNSLHFSGLCFLQV